MQLHAVIMAGGSGTRFWPASRQSRPKQFLPLLRGETLIGATIARAQALVGRERTWVVTNARQAELLRSALPAFPATQVIVEPEPRDTAPCVALAAAVIEARDPGASIAVMPADHVIEPAEAFHRLLRRGAAIAADGQTLVTFGIRPRRPATSYGYIEQGPALDDASPPAHHVLRFREKPDLATARSFLDAGRFLWNSGIFVWTAPALLAAMDAGAHELAAAARAMLAAQRAGDAAAVTAAFCTAPKISVDFAVMEHAPRIAVVGADLQWDDVGSFVTLGAVAPSDAAGNVQVLSGGASAVLAEARNNVVYAEGGTTVCVFGADDLVVVAVGDAVLVCPKDRADDLKLLVQRVRESGRGELL